MAPRAADLVRQLKRDIKDDWYPDPFNYQDMLTENAVSTALAEALARGDGQFSPEPCTPLDIPKKNFILRYSLETGLVDRAYYHALASALFHHYDNLIPPNVLSYRRARRGRQGRYLFLNPIEQWKRLHAFIRQELRTKPYVLKTDIHNYYENVRIDDLIKTLESRISQIEADAAEKRRIRTVIMELNRCIRSWAFSVTHGLPQNRDASSILANIVLLPVDEAMLGRGYTYYRYMDDITIATESRYRARAALRDLIYELRRLGLNVNAQKTIILEPGSKNYHSSLFHADRTMDTIDSMWKSRSAVVIRRSLPHLRKFATRLINESRMGDKEFRFCIKRFEQLALCDDFSVPDEFYAGLVDASLRELDEQPWASDQIVRFLKAAPISNAQLARAADFLVDRERALYDWQNYLLWQLLVYKGYQEPRLLKCARLTAVNPDLPADRAGALHYLGALGATEDRERIAATFREYGSSHLLQRSALIAVHEVEFSPIVRDQVRPHVLPSLQGTYRRMRDSYRGIYCLPLPRTRATSIFDELSAYD